MARANSTRKRELLVQILDFLGDRPLSALSFRTVADALGVSTFTLVYQFGTRAELVSDVVEAIFQRQRGADEHLDQVPPSIDTHIRAIRASFEWQLLPENLPLLRLELESAVIEVLDEPSRSFTRTIYTSWVTEAASTLEDLGLSAEDARLEARLLTNLFYGFQYDLVVNGDTEFARTSFERGLTSYRARVAELVELGV